MMKGRKRKSSQACDYEPWMTTMPETSLYPGYVTSPYASYSASAVSRSGSSYSQSLGGGSGGYTTAPPTQARPTLAKRARKAVDSDPDASPPEKRLAIFKKKCPQNILQRVDRVMSQRFFMVDRRRDGLREEFSVLGSTGNVYTVVIDKKPSCTCPDALKGNHCKHILFIFLKVLQVSQASGHWYQKALLTSELEEIFSHAPVAPNAIAIAPTRVREEYARATGRPAPATIGVVDLTGSPSKRKGKDKSDGAKDLEDSQKSNKKIPGPDDDCPICYEGMHGVAEKSLEFCEECGKAVHNECFGQWKQTALRKGSEVTCVYCRAKWAVPAGLPGRGGGPSNNQRRGATISEGYLNLSGAAGLSPVRDTSSYYHGPWSCYSYQDYGYDYDDDFGY